MLHLLFRTKSTRTSKLPEPFCHIHGSSGGRSFEEASVVKDKTLQLVLVQDLGDRKKILLFDSLGLGNSSKAGRPTTANGPAIHSLPALVTELMFGAIPLSIKSLSTVKLHNLQSSSPCTRSYLLTLLFMPKISSKGLRNVRFQIGTLAIGAIVTLSMPAEGAADPLTTYWHALTSSLYSLQRKVTSILSDLLLNVEATVLQDACSKQPSGKLPLNFLRLQENTRIKAAFCVCRNLILQAWSAPLLQPCMFNEDRWKTLINGIVHSNPSNKSASFLKSVHAYRLALSAALSCLCFRQMGVPAKFMIQSSRSNFARQLLFLLLPLFFPSLLKQLENSTFSSELAASSNIPISSPKPDNLNFDSLRSSPTVGSSGSWRCKYFYQAFQNISRSAPRNTPPISPSLSTSSSFSNLASFPFSTKSCAKPSMDGILHVTLPNNTFTPLSTKSSSTSLDCTGTNNDIVLTQYAMYLNCLHPAFDLQAAPPNAFAYSNNMDFFRDALTDMLANTRRGMLRSYRSSSMYSSWNPSSMEDSRTSSNDFALSLNPDAIIFAVDLDDARVYMHSLQERQEHDSNLGLGASSNNPLVTIDDKTYAYMKEPIHHVDVEFLSVLNTLNWPQIARHIRSRVSRC
ncbi:hypothetical protein SJAG_04910 [Schizosaccharomyces japonicus yFS275]|uniref:Uncharacterized protein n=1 Tax=Schizosaccharomyces japonicus (strain yFS275 / FY16936) TaxID=402676 RepID=B6K834_SCHJY|nr:hypothetical protein SJAG_04910 [Schizosaccharomyces japonicus yFS275]EEB09688.1 hypothetical protein SJAG_04910 [Schizosaccharomyces japonicus yFS275]